MALIPTAIYGYFKRQLARVSVRAAMLRCARCASGGARPESSTDRGGEARKGERLAAAPRREWSGIPADRGSFGVRARPTF